MRSPTSKSLLSIVLPAFVLPAFVALSFGVSAGLGCAGVKPNQTNSSGGSNGSGKGGNNSGNGGSSSGSGGGGGNLPVTPISGDHTCTDFDSSSNCSSYNTSNNGNFNNNTSGSTSIVYPLNNSLFPSNLGPIQVHLSSSGSAARIHFLTTQSNPPTSTCSTTGPASRRPDRVAS